MGEFKPSVKSFIDVFDVELSGLPLYGSYVSTRVFEGLLWPS